MIKKGASSVVKVDSSLLERIEKIINKEENKFKFITKKHFVDVAINEYLNIFEKKGDKK